MHAFLLSRPRLLSNLAPINAYEFAKQMLEIHGRIRASHFTGVHDALFLGKDDASEVQYVIRGEKGRKSKFALHLSLNGQVNLLCQRCLEQIAFPLQHSAWFELVANESSLPQDDSDDETEYLVADAELDIEQLLGQELLLGLPLTPKHADARCSSVAETNTQQKPNPFSVLQGLKK